MKKLLAILIIAVIACFGFVGCVDDNESPKANGDGEISTIQPEQPMESEKPKPSQSEEPEQQEITKMYLTINGNKIEVTLAKNSAVDALVEKLKQGNITYTADDYGGFEKVGGLGFSLPTENSQITTQAGDVILYAGNQIVLFYGSNNWSYTRLGKIDGYSTAELKTLLAAGKGSVQVTISLT